VEAAKYVVQKEVKQAFRQRRDIRRSAANDAPLRH